MNANKDLSFQISNDRMVGMQYGLMYSKYIDRKIKRFIDSRINCLLESGIFKKNDEASMTRHLDIEEEDDLPQTISISYFKNILIIYFYAIIILIFNLIIEISIFVYKIYHYKKFDISCENFHVYRRESYRLSVISKTLQNLY